MALGGLLNHVALGASAAAAGPAAEAAPVPAAAPTGNILGGVFAQSASRSGFPESDPQQQQQQQEYIPEYWLHQPRDLNKVFEGCYFTLAALKGRQKEHEEALEKIRWEVHYTLHTETLSMFGSCFLNSWIHWHIADMSLTVFQTPAEGTADLQPCGMHSRTHAHTCLLSLQGTWWSDLQSQQHQATCKLPHSVCSVPRQPASC